MRTIFLTLTIFAISACGLFDYSHVPKEWEGIAKAQCKKVGYEKDPNASEKANFQLCVDRKVSEFRKKYRAERNNDGKMLPNIGFNFGFVFGL